MRFRRVMAAVVPAGVVSALAILPMGVSAAAGASTAAVGHVTPEVRSPLSYRYVGKAGSRAVSSGYQFTCQEPGATQNCYTPHELATAYDIPRTLTGAGQTIVLIDAFGDPTLGQDLAVEEKTFGLPHANVSIIYPNGKPAFNPANQNEVNWSGEIALDVESSHAIAPSAHIDLVIAKNDQDPAILSALHYAVSHRLGSVLSQSYGEAESCEASTIVKTDHTLFAAAAAQGMTVIASSGDDGVAQPTCNGANYFKSVGLPAADPLVTSVGGTSLIAAQPTGAYRSETAWDDDFGTDNGGFGASNGGYSKLFARPWYQSGTVPSRQRGVPDVAYSADVNNGLLIAWSQGSAANVGNIYLFGGTSAGAPQWAAIIALADQDFGHRVGFLNSRLYAIGRSAAAYGYAFHDITKGNNSVSLTNAIGAPVNITGYVTARGWDPVTGLGTPNVAHLIHYLH